MKLNNGDEKTIMVKGQNVPHRMAKGKFWRNPESKEGEGEEKEGNKQGRKEEREILKQN